VTNTEPKTGLKSRSERRWGISCKDPAKCQRDGKWNAEYRGIWMGKQHTM